MIMASPKKGDLNEEEKRLMEEVPAGNIEEVKSLLKEKGVRVDCLDEHGMTPLFQAAYKGSEEMCELLIAHGADVNSSEHDQGYTGLMFAALSGSIAATKVLLEAGARTSPTNSVGRTATQMAAFVGQHQCVSLINNFFAKDDLEYYIVPRGLEKEPKLPPHLCEDLYTLILNSNLNPVKISMYLQENTALLDEHKPVGKVLDILVQKMMKQSHTNEVMAIKFHYLSGVLKNCVESRNNKSEKACLHVWIKSLLKEREEDGFPEISERMIRAVLKGFPYPESQLLHQMVRSLAPVPIGGDPCALDVLTGSINGQRMASEEDMPCTTCGDFKAQKKCSACKLANYCNQNCQKLHWFTHKISCDKLKVIYERQQELKKLQEEKKRIEEELKKREEEEAQQIVELQRNKEEDGLDQTTSSEEASMNEDPSASGDPAVLEKEGEIGDGLAAPISLSSIDLKDEEESAPVRAGDS